MWLRFFASITTRSTPSSTSRLASSLNDRVIVECVVTSWTRRFFPKPRPVRGVAARGNHQGLSDRLITALLVIDHTNLYWQYETLPERQGGTVTTDSVDFATAG